MKNVIFYKYCLNCRQPAIWARWPSHTRHECCSIRCRNELKSRRMREAGKIVCSIHYRLWRVWSGMKKRCYDKKQVIYKYYGGRGIRVCRPWLRFRIFETWALGHGYTDKLTIERKNVNGDYKPSNCCFIPNTAQARNRRDSKRITAFGETKQLVEWFEDSRCKVKYTTLGKRIRDGVKPEIALTMPANKIGKNNAAFHI